MMMSLDEAKKELEKALDNNTIHDVEESYKYISAIHIAIDAIDKLKQRREADKLADVHFKELLQEVRA